MWSATQQTSQNSHYCPTTVPDQVHEPIAGKAQLATIIIDCLI